MDKRYKIKLNGVDYVEFPARFIGLDSSGHFDFVVLDDGINGHAITLTAYRSMNDVLPASLGFGLPHLKNGESICPNTHTLRMQENTYWQLVSEFDAKQRSTSEPDKTFYVYAFGTNDYGIRTAPIAPENTTQGRLIALYKNGRMIS